MTVQTADGYAYLDRLPACRRPPCWSCGYPEKLLVPARLDLIGLADSPAGLLVVCPACGATLAALADE